MLTSPLFNGLEKKKLYSKILRTHVFFLETLVLEWSIKSNTEMALKFMDHLETMKTLKAERSMCKIRDK